MPWVWIILAGALVLRAGIVIATENHLGGDAILYDAFARSLAAGDWLPDSHVAGDGPTAFFPPLFPGLLGVVYAVTGDSVTAARLVQALLGTAVVAMVGLIALQVWGRRVALIALAIAAVFPAFLLSSTTLFAEPLFMVFALAAIAAVLQHRATDEGYRWLVLAGVLVGLATLTRANGIILLLPLAAGAITHRPLLSGPAMAQPLVLALAAVLVIAPWSIRNTIAFDDFVPLTTQSDLAVARNYNPAAAPTATPRDTEELLALTRTDQDEAEIAADARRLGREYIADHPGLVIEASLKNTARALGVSDGPDLAEASAADEGGNARIADLAIISFYALFLLAVVGAFVPAARRAPWWMWAAPILMWLSVVWLAAGRTRYRVPVDPFLIMLASLAIAAAWDRLTAGGAQRHQPPRRVA